MCLASKNLKNTGTFLIRNVLSCVDSETKTLKKNLNENQKEVLSFVNESIRIINEKRIVKNVDKQEKLNALQASLEKQDINQIEFNEQIKKLKPGKLFSEITENSGTGDFWAVLDDTVLDQLLRYRKDQNNETPFQVLPAKASEQVRKQISASFKSWLASLATFNQSPANYTGRPKMPGYMDKDGLNAVKFFAGSLGGKALPTIEDRALFLDYDKSTKLSEAGFQAYKNFDLIKVKEQLRNQLSKDKQATANLVEIRIIPKGRLGREKFFVEGVFECDIELREGTILERLTNEAARLELSEDKKQRYFLDQFSIQGLNIPTAGGDLGLNNFITLAFNQGSVGQVISNQRLEKKINLFDRKIDNLKASLATPRQRALQKQQNIAPLSKSEMIELKKLQKAMFEHAGLQTLIEDRKAWLKNALHTASRGVVDLLIKNGIQAFFVGRNKGWKQESAMGKKMNRRFQATAHAEFITLLRYKCEDAGILFLETEESYTSKTSFATGEILKEYKEKENTESKETKLQAEVILSNMPDPRAAEMSSIVKKAGVRKAVKGAKSKGQHQFTSTVGCNLKRWTHIHADMNGAYNIIRKVIPAFCVNRKLSSEFRLLWVAPTGLATFRTRKDTNLSREWASDERRVISADTKKCETN